MGGVIKSSSGEWLNYSSCRENGGAGVEKINKEDSRGGSWRESSTLCCPGTILSLGNIAVPAITVLHSLPMPLCNVGKIRVAVSGRNVSSYSTLPFM